MEESANHRLDQLRIVDLLEPIGQLKHRNAGGRPLVSAPLRARSFSRPDDLGKLPDTHAIYPISYLPASGPDRRHSNACDGGLQRCSAPTMPLTRLARFARGQSPCYQSCASH